MGQVVYGVLEKAEESGVGGVLFCRLTDNGGCYFARERVDLIKRFSPFFCVEVSHRPIPLICLVASVSSAGVIISLAVSAS